MDKTQVFRWVLNQYGTEPDYPWNDENAVLRHHVSRKWYAAVLHVSRCKLGLSGEGSVDVINLKCDPRLIGTLRLQEGYHAAYHMNKEQWISIRLDGSVPEEEIQNLIALSFDLTAGKK